MTDSKLGIKLSINKHIYKDRVEKKIFKFSSYKLGNVKNQERTNPMGIKILSRLAELLKPRQEKENEEITVHSVGALAKDSSKSEVAQQSNTGLIAAYRQWRIKKNKEFNEKVIWSPNIDKELEFTRNIKSEREFINKTNRLLNVFNSIYNIEELVYAKDNNNDYYEINKKFSENSYACQLFNNFQIERLSDKEAKEMDIELEKEIVWKLIFQCPKAANIKEDKEIIGYNFYEKELESLNAGISEKRKIPIVYM